MRLLIWLCLAVGLTLPLLLATQSPQLAWRSPIYIAAGFAGIIAMSALVMQPLLAARALPGIKPRLARTLHRGIGALLVLLIIAHVGGLWITSPPDVVDALTFTSPTPFSVWGVLAMWALFGSALLAVNRSRLHPRWWLRAHLTLGGGIIAGTILHVLLIEGTMEIVSKWALATVLALIFIATVLRRLTRG